MDKEKIAIASDHGGFRLKEEIKKLLTDKWYEVVDFGTGNGEESVHYPIYGIKAARAVSEGEFKKAILVCGTGIGMSIVANKFPGVRGTLCHNLFTAKMSRQHNDSNLLILGGRILDPVDAEGIVKMWLETPFEGGRHQDRLNMITNIEKGML
jgi:ribose 5-phosphate isomerase B